MSTSDQQQAAEQRAGAAARALIEMAQSAAMARAEHVKVLAQIERPSDDVMFRLASARRQAESQAAAALEKFITETAQMIGEQS